jgi:hypothetical protein
MTWACTTWACTAWAAQCWRAQRGRAHHGRLEHNPGVAIFPTKMSVNLMRFCLFYNYFRPLNFLKPKLNKLYSAKFSDALYFLTSGAIRKQKLIFTFSEP